MRALASSVILAVVVASAPAAASPVHGLVFADSNGDGVPQAEERGVAHAVVAFRDQVFTTTDGGGAFTLDVPDGVDGELWVRVPDGFVPGPVWAHVPARHADASFDLALRRLPDDAAPRAVRFVIAADTHMHGGDQPWSTSDLIGAVEQATQTDPPPLFFTILGDLTQGSEPKQFTQLATALANLDVPWIPVAGNHDWIDKGAWYRAHYGPESYSFDARGVHFIVWSSNSDDDATIAYLRRELSFVDPAMPIVALGHAPPHQKVIDAMIAAGVDYLFCGHWHANRVIDHGGLIELDTEPFIMGGIDASPAGYRVVTIENGRLTTEHGTVVDGPYARVVAPAVGCARGDADLVVAADVGAGAGAGNVAVTASIDGLPPVALAYAGGWDYHAPLAALDVGDHRVHVVATGPAGSTTTDATITICDAPPAAKHRGEWPGLGGGPTHQGARDAELAPPLATAWTAVLGGHVHMGAPVVYGGRVFATVTDFARGDTGGIVALDLATGAEAWRWTAPLPVRNAPAVAAGIVVTALDDGTVVALDAEHGTERWRAALGEGTEALVHTLWAAPTIADGVVYIGPMHHLAALDLRTGRALWQLDPVPRGDWLATFASAAVDGGVVVDTFHRDVGGVIAFDQVTGDELWRVEGGPAVAIHASPVIVDDRVFVANGKDEVHALDLATGAIAWETSLDPGGFDWGYAIAGTPATADGRLFVPTQYHDLVALDATTGVELWRHGGGEAPVHVTHYRGHSDGFLGAPVVTGGIVWIGGADGTLTALAAETGEVLWAQPIGAPILSGVAVAGDALVVASYDGTVRALVPAPAEVATPPSGCGCGATGRGDPIAIALAVIAGRLRRRRRRATLAA